MSDESLNLLERDLTQFKAQTAGAGLGALRQVIYDYSLSWEQLEEKLSPTSLRFLIALLTPDSNRLTGNGIPPTLLAEIAAARALADRELSAVLKHPAVVRQMNWQQEFKRAKEAAGKALEQGTRFWLAGDPYFNENEGRLTPRVRLAAVATGGGPALVIDCDAEDILLIVSDFMDAAQQEMERSVPMAKKELLTRGFGEFTGIVLDSIADRLERLRELARELGIDVDKKNPAQE
jgi:hypothetical protein